MALWMVAFMRVHAGSKSCKSGWKCAKTSITCKLFLASVLKSRSTLDARTFFNIKALRALSVEYLGCDLGRLSVS